MFMSICSLQAHTFHHFFTPKPKLTLSEPSNEASNSESKVVSQSGQPENSQVKNLGEIFCGYLSDISEDERRDENEENERNEENEGSPTFITAGSSSASITPAPKHQKLDIPARDQRKFSQEARHLKYQEGLAAIDKLIASKKEHFDAGRNGLQASRAQAIQSCLRMILQGGARRQTLTDASERAAESQGFAPKWGGRMVRSWVSHWIKSRDLPESGRGCHSKVYSLLDDPEVCTELRSYLRTNKWSMNPQKLSEFTKNKLFPGEAKKYLQNVVEKEMPNG